MKKTIKFLTIATLTSASCFGGIKGLDRLIEVEPNNREFTITSTETETGKNNEKNNELINDSIEKKTSENQVSSNSDVVDSTLEIAPLENSEETDNQENHATNENSEETKENLLEENSNNLNESNNSLEPTNNLSENTLVISYEKTFEEINTNLNESITMLEEIYSYVSDNENEPDDKLKFNNSLEEIIQLISNLKEETKEIKCAVNPNECAPENIDSTREFDSYYIDAIEKLEHRIDSLQSAFMMLKNNASNSPYFSFYNNPYANVYGYNYRFYPNIIEPSKNDDIDENNSNNNDTQTINEENQTTDINNDTNANLANEEANENKIDETDNQEPTTKARFGEINLKSNIDSYGPKNRNIDTFFNTALIDNNMYGYGPYGMPYGANYGGGPFSYGMSDINGYGYNSNNGYYNPNMFRNYGYNGYNNSNSMNNNLVTNESENNNLDSMKNDKEVDSTSLVEPQEDAPRRVKFAKNIDTYLDKTISGNINTMKGMKVTEYLKAKFNNIFRKKKVSEETVDNYVNQFINANTNNDKSLNDNNIKNNINKNNSKNNKKMDENIGYNLEINEIIEKLPEKRAKNQQNLK